MTQGAIPVERWNLIEQELAARDYVRTLDLVDKLDVSVETVRRDLASMESKGLLVRVRGGAVGGNRTREEAPYVERSVSDQSKKSAIGIAAAELVKNNAVIVIDVGTTALHLVKSLRSDFTGLIITNSLQAAAMASERLECEVMVIGGKLRSGDMAISGNRGKEFLKDFCPDVSFLGSGGICSSTGLTDYHYEEVELRRTMIEVSARSWALVDSTKFNKVAPFRVSGLNSLTGIITDTRPPSDLVDVFTEFGGEIVVGHRTDDPS